MRERFGKRFFDLLNSQNVEHVPNMLYAMGRRMDRELFWDPVELLMRILENRETFMTQLEVDEIQGHAVVKRVAITPTRLLFFQPDLMQVGVTFDFDRYWDEVKRSVLCNILVPAQDSYRGCCGGEIHLFCRLEAS